MNEIAKWNKTPLDSRLVNSIAKKYRIDVLYASILARRGVTAGSDIAFFLEKDKRYQHSPFLFKNMEDAVDRILGAIEEGERILIFGDRDADGVCATSLLYLNLKAFGADVLCQVPQGDESYGLCQKAIDDFAAKNGTLIITVDCGISCKKEIEYAKTLHIDVIVTDHHNVTKVLPQDTIIIDPKQEASGYPMKEICGCAVAYKLSQALRFAKYCEIYKQPICLLHVLKKEETYFVQVLKICNLTQTKTFSMQVLENTGIALKEQLFDFLKGQQIFVWNEREQKKLLYSLFGDAVQFNVFDFQSIASKVLPQAKTKSLEEMVNLSKIAIYSDKPTSIIEGFCNIFVTCTDVLFAKTNPTLKVQEESDIQLVAIATLADVMPLENENRIFIKRALHLMTQERTALGLRELFSALNILGNQLSSQDLSWKVTPVLNAAGRLGKPEIAVELFVNAEDETRQRLAFDLIEINKQRKQLGAAAWNVAFPFIKPSIESHSRKLCYIYNEKINRGVTGILAARIAESFGVPAIVATKTGQEQISGSMRSAKGLEATSFLSRFSHLFLNYGGHDMAAGFSLPLENRGSFETQLSLAAKSIQQKVETKNEVNIDAQLPMYYLRPDILNLIDCFEPYGQSFLDLVFATEGVKVFAASLCGTSGEHLRLTLDCGKHKLVAMFWGQGDRLKKQINIGDTINILYQINRNTFRGTQSPQLILLDIKKGSI